MSLKLICYQCSIYCYLYEMFYVSHVATKNVKAYSRFTESKEKGIKAQHYTKLSVHSSNCCAEQLSCPGLHIIFQD